MSQLLEIPDELYLALQTAAREEGTTPPGWITSHLPDAPGTAGADQPNDPRNLADLFAGRVGQIRSGGHERLSEECGERLADHLEEKRKAGCL